MAIKSYNRKINKMWNTFADYWYDYQIFKTCMIIADMWIVNTLGTCLFIVEWSKNFCDNYDWVNEGDVEEVLTVYGKTLHIECGRKNVPFQTLTSSFDKHPRYSDNFQWEEEMPEYVLIFFKIHSLIISL